MDLKSKLLLASVLLVSTGSFAGTTRVQEADSFISSDHTKSYSLPAASATLTGNDSTATLTNKTISGASNTLSQLPVATQTVQSIVSPYPNSSATSFTLDTAPGAGAGVGLYLDGILLVQGASCTGNVEYTISGSTITMCSAPSTGQILYAVYSAY